MSFRVYRLLSPSCSYLRLSGQLNAQRCIHVSSSLGDIWKKKKDVQVTEVAKVSKIKQLQEKRLNMIQKLKKSITGAPIVVYLKNKNDPQPTTVKDDRDRMVGNEIDTATTIKDVVIAGLGFADQKDKDKESFLEEIEKFSKTITKNRFGQVEFIYAGMRVMKEFNVHKDLQVYKALMDVFPKERMKPTNQFQAAFWHYYKQQLCATKLLDEMELCGVMPDAEMEQLVINIFSKKSQVWRKVARQLYWFSKFQNASPFPLPEKLPTDSLELAKIAIKRMCIDLQTKIGVFAVWL